MRFLQIKRKAKVELCQKIFNFTEEQDLKLKLGYDLLERVSHAASALEPVDPPLGSTVCFRVVADRLSAGSGDSAFRI